MVHLSCPAFVWRSIDKWLSWSSLNHGHSGEIGIENLRYSTVKENMTNWKLKQNLNLKILFSKIFLISKFMIVSIIKYKLWIINLLSFIIMFFFFKKININLKIFYVIAFINLSFLFAVYIHTPYDLKFLLTVTLDRLVFHTSGFYLPIFLILIKKLLNTSYNSRSKT